MCVSGSICIQYWIQVPCGDCDHVIKRRHLEEHNKGCPMKIIDCPFAQYGCKHTFKRGLLPGHLCDYQHGHLTLMRVAFSSYQMNVDQRLNFLSTEVQKIKKTIITSADIGKDSNVKALETENRKLRWRMQKCEQRLRALESAQTSKSKKKKVHKPGLFGNMQWKQKKTDFIVLDTSSDDDSTSRYCPGSADMREAAQDDAEDMVDSDDEEIDSDEEELDL